MMKGLQKTTLYGLILALSLITFVVQFVYSYLRSPARTQHVAVQDQSCIAQPEGSRDVLFVGCSGFF